MYNLKFITKEELFSALLNYYHVSEGTIMFRDTERTVERLIERAKEHIDE